MLRRSGKILLSIAGVLCVFFVIGAIQFFAWKRYEPPITVGSYVKTDETNLISVTKQWYENYIDSLKGPAVPYDWRIHSARQIYIAPLEQPGYVELAYLIEPESRNLNIISNLGLAVMNGNYTSQMVLHWEKETDGWKLTDTMTSDEYAAMLPSAETQKEDKSAENTHRSQMDDSDDKTYFVQDETLYVTYDGGNTSVEVPDGYELVCMGGSEIPDENLEWNSYIVSSEFTGFIGYDGDNVYLIHSEDSGQSWEKSLIYVGYKARSFLSMTDNGWYAAFATERSNGSDCYETFYSEDSESWHLSPIPIPEDLSGHLTCAYWTSDGTAYFANGMYGYVVESGSQESQMIELHDNSAITVKAGFDPFVEIDAMYEQDDGLYMIIGQGDDGNYPEYTENGQLVSAVYRSEDGINFYFQETIPAEPTEVG